MAKDMSDAVGQALGSAAREIGQSVIGGGRKRSRLPFGGGGNDGPLSGGRGVAAGAALAGAAPLVGKAVKRMVSSRRKGSANGAGPVERVTEKARDTVARGARDAAGDVAERAGGASGVAKAVGERVIPGVGSGDGDDAPAGIGEGRRMPVQQQVDVAVPIRVAYDQWTQFEEWPEFMHRLDQATQEDDCTVSFRTKIWGMSREFVASIDEQRPDERIKWSVDQGVTHTGVVTFHELAPRLTRVQVSLDVEPGSWLEKAARGMRHVKRAVRADMARYKAYVEMSERATGGWRGTIRDGEVVDAGESDGDGEERGSPRGEGESERPPGGGKERQRGGGSQGDDDNDGDGDGERTAVAGGAGRGAD